MAKSKKKPDSAKDLKSLISGLQKLFGVKGKRKDVLSFAQEFAGQFGAGKIKGLKPKKSKDEEPEEPEEDSKEEHLNDLEKFLSGAKYTGFQSSNVRSVAYDDDASTMYVGYKGKKGSTNWYGYQDVSAREATAMFSTSSKGRAVWDMLRVRGSKTGHQKDYFQGEPPDFGLSTIRDRAKNKKQKKALGGVIQQRFGTPGQDNEPISAEPGEFVVPKHAAQEHKELLEGITFGSAASKGPGVGSGDYLTPSTDAPGSHFAGGGAIPNSMFGDMGKEAFGSISKLIGNAGDSVKDWMKDRYGMKTALGSLTAGNIGTWAASGLLSLGLQSPAILPPGTGIASGVAIAEIVKQLRKRNESDSEAEHMAKGRQVKKRHRQLTEQLHDVLGEHARKIGHENLPDFAADVESRIGKFRFSSSAPSAVIPDESFDIPRKYMPQIEAEHLDEFIESLKAKGIEGEKTKMPVGQLKPSQNEIGLAQIAKNFLRSDKRLAKKTIIASEDDYILDGHHGWAGMKMKGEDYEANVLKLALPFEDLLREARGFDKAGYMDVGAKEITRENVQEHFANAPDLQRGRHMASGKIVHGGQRDYSQFPNDDLFKELFGTTDKEVLRDAMGAPEDADIKWLRGGRDRIEASAYHPSLVGMDRGFVFDDSYGKFAENQYFRTEKTGTGLGLSAFSKQVNTLQGMGFDKIKAEAGGSGRLSSAAARKRWEAAGMVGYYTWPRMGFDAEIESLQPELLSMIKENFPGAESIQDVMSAPGGKEWWKNYGSAFSGEFDLSEGSRSLQVLESYKQERMTALGKQFASASQQHKAEGGEIQHKIGIRGQDNEPITGEPGAWIVPVADAQKADNKAILQQMTGGGGSHKAEGRQVYGDPLKSSVDLLTEPGEWYVPENIASKPENKAVLEAMTPTKAGGSSHMADGGEILGGISSMLTGGLGAGLIGMLASKFSDKSETKSDPLGAAAQNLNSAAKELSEAAKVIQDSTRVAFDHSGMKAPGGSSLSDTTWMDDLTTGMPKLVKRSDIAKMPMVNRIPEVTPAKLGFMEQFNADARGIFNATKGVMAPGAGGAAAGGAGAAAGGAGAAAPALGEALSSAATGPVGMVAAGVMMLKQKVDEFADSIRDVDNVLVDVTRSFGELIGVPKSISELVGSVVGLLSPMRMFADLLKSPMDFLKDPAASAKESLARLADVGMNLARVFLDLRDPASMLGPAVSAFVGTANKFSPASVERMQLAFDNLSAAAGTWFLPIIEGARELADEFNVLYTQAAPEMNAAVAEIVAVLKPLARDVGADLIRLFVKAVPIVSELVTALIPFGEVAGRTVSILANIGLMGLNGLATILPYVNNAMQLWIGNLQEGAATIGAASMLIMDAVEAIRDPRRALDFFNNIGGNFRADRTNMLANMREQNRPPIMGAQTFAAMPARQVGIEDVGLEARRAAFSMGGRDIPQEQLDVQREIRDLLARGNPNPAEAAMGFAGHLVGLGSPRPPLAGGGPGGIDPRPPLAEGGMAGLYGGRPPLAGGSVELVGPGLNGLPLPAAGPGGGNNDGALAAEIAGLRQVINGLGLQGTMQAIQAALMQAQQLFGRS